MIGPICVKCGAIGEYVLGWEKATSMVVTEQREKLESIEHKIMSKDRLSKEHKQVALSELQKADDHLSMAQKLANKSSRKKK